MAKTDDHPKDDTPAPEPAWIRNLARAGLAAEAAQNRYRKGGTLGAANAGRSVRMWNCTCGWTGGMKDLNALPSGLACPSCGEPGRLSSA